MRRIYRKYLLTGGIIPRTTRWRHKKKADLELLQEQEKQQLQQNGVQTSETACSVDNDHAIQSNQILDTVPDNFCDNISLNDSINGSISTSDTNLSTNSSASPSKRRKFVENTIRSDNPINASHSSDSTNEGSCSSSPPSPHFEINEIYNRIQEMNSMPESTNFDKQDIDVNCLHESNGVKNNKLCPCIETTSADIMFMTLSLGLRHNLSWDAQVDILKMFSSIYGENKMPSTKYKYFKELNIKNCPISYHIYCNVCEVYLGKKEDVPDIKNCFNCDAAVNVKDSSNYFASLSLESQLQNFVKDESFVNNILNYRFKRQSNRSFYSDIFDGATYKRLFENNGILSDPYNFSYTFFIDGIACGNSSKKTIWPIYLTINELPPEERCKYMLLVGIYVGKKDPNLQTFLKPFVIQGNNLASSGFPWVHNGKNIISYVIPTCCVADSVARFKLLNFQSFHSCYGCTFCYQLATRTKSGRRLTVQKPAAIRTLETLKRDLNEVYSRRNARKKKDRVYKGVKGPTPLIFLKYFNVTLGFIVDYMHAILLGVIKRHTELLLDPSRKRMWFRMADEVIGIEHLVKTIDDKLNEMQSNSSVIRELRPISERALWKASEWRSWLIFYSFATLSGLLKDKYLAHLCLLSKATHLLLKKRISHDELAHAHKLLMTYMFYFEKYFGPENMFYNVHLLKHIAPSVEEHGPIWATNSFLYESFNRNIRQYCKSLTFAVIDIARKFMAYKSLPSLCSEMRLCSETIEFSAEILDYKRLKNTCQLNGCTLLGKGVMSPLSQDELSALLVYTNNVEVNYYECFERMIFNHTQYSTDFYCQGKKNNDSCAITIDGDFVKIKRVLILQGSNVVLLVEPLRISRRPLLLYNHTIIDHIVQIDGKDNVKCIELNCISQPCMLMSLHNASYLSVIPYGCSID